MKDRILLKEIPAGKFDAAIFTTYSFNFYYFEQQVLPMLGSKGISYVSVLVDGAMLSKQLDLYSSLSEQRKRSYSIHGIQSNSSFHPKLIFLTGETSILLLLGSGNLTTAGHGKNLESWNAVYIDNPLDEKLGFAKQCWDYLKTLHKGLGRSAEVKLKTIEDSCGLFREMDKSPVKDFYLNNKSSISFLSSAKKESLFIQLRNLISDEPIQSVTVMCPYYDIDGKFLKLINDTYKPQRIDIVLQSEFGAAPVNLVPEKNMHFYDWEKIKSEEIKQDFFHAKNIILEGKKFDFLLSGSANASIAAFGGINFPGANTEACVLHRTAKTNFKRLLGLQFGATQKPLPSFKYLAERNESDTQHLYHIYVKAVEKGFDRVFIYWFSKKDNLPVRFCLFNGKGKTSTEFEIDSKKGDNELSLQISAGSNFLYGAFFNDKIQISNKQFVIDTNAFEGTNPSPGNRTLNQIRKIIEGGNFSTPKIIEYLSTLHNKHTATSSKSIVIDKEKSDSEIPVFEEDRALFYLTYEQIQEEISKLSQSQKQRTYVNYRSVRLWDSIFAYLKEARLREEEERIDEEETENTDISRGRRNTSPQSNRRPISLSNFQRLQKRIEGFLNNYWDILESKVNNVKTEKPTLIDLSMYLIMVEILLHLAAHKEVLEEDEDETRHLLRLEFRGDEFSWSECVIKFTGLFSLWCSQMDGFENSDSSEYMLKLKLYMQMAFKSSVALLSLIPLINQNNTEYEILNWAKLSLLNIHSVFNDDFNKAIETFMEFLPREAREQFGEQNIENKIISSLKIIERLLNNLELNNIYLHQNDGYGYVAKVVKSPDNSAVKFLKLINTGYEWDEDLGNYWNGKLFSISENRWISAKKSKQ